MYKGKTFLAVIPARGGSKGIPKKNIIDVKGKPLIYYSISEALQSAYLDTIIVSTDSEEIAKKAQQCGAEVPFMRPAYLADDYAKTIDVIVHAVNQLKEKGKIFDYIVVLQPTQPLRKAWHIDEAIEQIVNESQNNLVSVSKVKDHPLLIRTIQENGQLKNLLQENSTVRRQDLQIYYKVNGAIYINKIDYQFNKELSLNDNKCPYIMDSKYDLDIDDMNDLRLFEIICE